MPNNFLSMDTNFPSFTGEESTTEKLKAIQDYLYKLLEQLRYTLNNLDTSNFNQPALNKWEETITEPLKAFIESETGEVTEMIVGEGGISSRISDAERNISQVSQTVDGIGIKVTGGAGEQTTIAITKDGVAASTDLLDLTGTVLFRDLSTAGQTVINGGNITTGVIQAIQMIGNAISGGTIDGTIISSENAASIDAQGNRRLVGVLTGQGVVNLTDRYETDQNKVYVGRLIYDWYNNRVLLETATNRAGMAAALKIQSLSNMSIDAGPGKTVYIGNAAQDGGTQAVHIGSVNETDAVSLYGNVRISPDGSNFWTFEADGIYLNGTKVVSV